MRVLGYLLFSVLFTISSAKEGLDVFLVGDFGQVVDLSIAERTFNSMNDIVKEAKTPEDNIDYIFTMGDNIYPAKPTAPTDDEFELMMSLFNKSHLDNKTIYPIRGNHDCRFDINRELELAKQYPKWNMKSLYYEKLFDIGNGKKFGVLFVDSCLVICSNFSYSSEVKTPRLEESEYLGFIDGEDQGPQELQNLKEFTCNP